MIDMQITGMGNLTKRVESLQDARFLQAIVQAAAVQVAGAMKDAVPPSKSGPGRISLTTQRPMGWYERGRGWWYPVMRKQTLGQLGKAHGSIRSSKLVRQSSAVVGYKLAGGGKSEGFSLNRWTIRSEDAGLTAVVGNNASYGHWVMGDDQTQLMGRLGWPKARMVVMREWPRIMSAAQTQMKAYLAGK